MLKFLLIKISFSEHIGESIIYLWIDVIREFIENENCCELENNEINKAFITNENFEDDHAVIESTSVEKGIFKN